MLERHCLLMGLFLLSQAHPWFLSFAGYAVTAGHFSHVSSTDVVGGAPQDEGIGKVRRKVCRVFSECPLLNRCYAKHSTSVFLLSLLLSEI